MERHDIYINRSYCDLGTGMVWDARELGTDLDGIPVVVVATADDAAIDTPLNEEEIRRDEREKVLTSVYEEQRWKDLMSSISNLESRVSTMEDSAMDNESTETDAAQIPDEPEPQPSLSSQDVDGEPERKWLETKGQIW